MEKYYQIATKGKIYYRIEGAQDSGKTLVFLPGLTADHRLFAEQIHYFKSSYNTLVWDAPAHNLSRPWTLDFSLMDMARYLREILQTEGITRPILIGQSLGGYIAQSYMELYPDDVEAFISIDSAPLQRKYMSSLEIYMLKHTKPLFSCYSWNTLKNATIYACATTEKGKAIMRQMMSSYTRNEYIELSAYGYKILAEAVESDLAYKLNCPALLICGTKDRAGYVRRYNRIWGKSEKLPIHWIDGAGHNSNTDYPNQVNSIIESFLKSI